ncbi:MAG: hypothetical protein Q8R15_01590 [Candidatus Micrarchaeota archaeon]|nr:hypothetical protein [Candidatus Micrarchaeota archaeon]
MGNRWGILALLLIMSLPLLNALPANLVFSQPATVFAEQTNVYSINYTAIDENNTPTFPLTPSEHNAACRYLFSPVDPDDPLGFNFTYNASSQAHELAINYAPPGNASFTIQCTADGFDTMTIENTTQEVLAVPTNFSTSISTSNTTATLTVTYYSQLNGSGNSLTPEENNAQCSASVYEDDTDELVAEIGLDYIGGDYDYFLATVELEPGTSYYWDVECSAEPNFETASGQSDKSFYIDEASCQQVDVTSDTTLSQGKTCSNDGSSAAPLFVISADNVTLDCNGATLRGVGSNSGGRMAISASGVSNVNILNCNADGFSWPIWASDSNNVSFRNLSVTNSGDSNSILIIGSNNTLVDNFTCINNSIGGAPSVWISSSENTTISNGVISNYGTAIFAFSNNNTIITNVTVNSANTGLEDNGGTTATNLVFNNTYLALLLTGSGSILQNVSIYNSPFSAGLEATVAILSNNTIANISIYNSSSDAVWLGGFNNSLTISASNVNGTAINLIAEDGGAVNNTINFTSLSNNALDLNITDATNSVYGNVFNGNFSSVFFNVTNSTQSTIASFNQVTFSANGAIITSNLTLTNSTGVVNSSNLTNSFTLSITSAVLNSSAMPFLSQPAVITLIGATYTNNSIYEVLRDGVVCSDSICTKISSSPASFRVTGFSNYSTRLIPIAVEAAPASSSSNGGGSGGGGPAPTNQPIAQNTTANQTSQNVTTNQTASELRTNQTQPLPNEQNTTNPNELAQQSPATGLFAGIPKELNNPYAVGAGVAVIALLGFGYFYFLRKP